MSLSAGSVFAELGGKFSPAGFQAFGSAMTGAKRDMETGERAIAASSGRSSKAMAKMGTMAKGAAAAGVVALGAAVVSSAKKYASFEKQLLTFKTTAGATAGDIARLEKVSHKLGISSGLGATAVADAATELAKGGLKIEQIFGGGLQATIALATAGEMELAAASETVANALNLFNLEGGQAGHVADALQTAAAATTADVADFAMAMTQGGAAAKTAGLDFDETVTWLEALAANAVKGSDAGTSLKSALTQLASPTDEAAALMKKYGIDVFDAHRNMLPLPKLAGEFREGLKGLNKEQLLQAVTTMAGTDGMRALLALYDQGERGTEKFAKGLKKQGTAAEAAKEKSSGLEGTSKRLKAAWESVSITFGKALAPALVPALEAIGGKLSEMVEDGTIEKFGKGLGWAIGALIDGLPLLADAFRLLAPGFSALFDNAKGALDGFLGLLSTAIDATVDLVNTFNDLPFAPNIDTSGLEQAAADINRTREEIRGDKLTFRFEVDDSQKSKLDALHETLKAMGKKQLSLDIVTNAPDAKTAIAALTAAAVGVPKRVITKIEQNAPSAQSAVLGFNAVLSGIPLRKVLRIYQNAPDARSAVSALQDAINALPSSKTITITTKRIEQLQQLPTIKPHMPKKKAAGGRTSGPELAWIGEGRDPVEWIIPRDPQYRGRAVDLLMDAASTILPGHRAGTKTGPKTPTKKKPKKKRWVPAKKDFLELSPEQFDEDRDDKKRRLDRLEQDAKEKDRNGHYTRKALAARRQIAKAKRELEKARALAQKARSYANRVEAAQDDAEIARNAMDLADKRDEQGKYDKALGDRQDALKRLRGLLQTALGFGKHGSKWRRDIAKELGVADIEIQDASTAKSEAAQEAADAAADTSLKLTADEQRRLDDLERDVALASLTEPLDDDRTALSQLLGLREGILGRVQGAGAPADAIAEAATAMKQARDDLRDLTSSGPSEDLQAQLNQANERARVEALGRQDAERSLRVLGSPGGMNPGQIGLQQNFTIQTLHPGDPATLSAIARASNAGNSYGGTVSSPRVKV